ncbi:hypothetical protein OPV22_026355 [Ensete ventricosum]|uniref:Uncharacterized protein n=1 Tax=Ensete ventricosum TaxID=4639 RepID=A0AAV8QAH6_ENSVE|nr:hypothetical protein OPV22_026355 [Ensete ventricosum]
MACCTSLRPPILPYRQALAKMELYVGASDLVRVSGKATSRTAMRLFNINQLIGMKKAVSRGNHPYRSLPRRKLYVSVMSFDTVNLGTHTTISGYWVGPDTEDGWGYVEAVVDRSV